MMKCSSLEENRLHELISHIIYDILLSIFYKNIGRALRANHFPVFYDAKNGHGIVRSTYTK